MVTLKKSAESSLLKHVTLSLRERLAGCDRMSRAKYFCQHMIAHKCNNAALWRHAFKLCNPRHELIKTAVKLGLIK